MSEHPLHALFEGTRQMLVSPVAQIWFGLIPLEGIDGPRTYISPFPFASVDFQTTPMNGP
ncbi:hypothetical protein ACWPKO_23625 (plasmid) [Coraliomargarita sp. W4R53]